MEALEQLDEILTVVEAFGFDDYTVKLSIARGLDYYTGVVFEIYVPDLGAQKQITGGGTYNLTSLFDSEDVESTGFAFGFDRIMEAFHKQKLEVEEENCNKVLVVPVKKEFKIEAIKVAQILRDADIITDIDLKGKKLKKNLSFANANNINNVVLIGQKEIEEDTVTLKHMDTKEQVSIPRSQLVENILNN
jgi:histidyl-tRNA synthetase